MQKTYLFLILLLAILLRVVYLDKFPPSLNWDEVSHAYNAYSLLRTGRDQWGQVLPLVSFRAYGDYPAPINLYFTAPFVLLFGPTDFAARLPHALIGAIGVIPIFAAAYCWSKNFKLALLASLLFAITPWALFPSRAVFQSNWTLFLMSIFLALYLRSSFRLSFLFLGLSLFSYHNARIFIPLFAVFLLVYFRRHLFFILAVLGLSVLILLSPSSLARGNWVGILDPGVISGIEQSRLASSLPAPFPRLIYNRPVYLVNQFVSHLLGYFCPQFLALSGGTQFQYSLPGFGVLLWPEAVFFYLGLILILFKLKSSSPTDKLLLVWLFLAAFPAAVTRDKFAVIRSNLMIPPVVLISAWGLWWSWSQLKTRLRKIYIFAIIISLFIFLDLYMENYFKKYPVNYSQSWQFGYKEVANYVKNHYQDYNQIIITKRYGEPHEFVAFYWPWDPADFQAHASWDFHANWYWINGLDKIKFVVDREMADTVANLPIGKKYLIVSDPDFPTLGRNLTQINFLDNKPAFIIKEL